MQKKEKEKVTAAELKAYRMKKKLCASAAGGCIAAVATTVPALAAPSESGGSNDAVTMAQTVVGLILSLAKYGGVALIAWGAYQVIISFVNDNPQGRIGGVTFLFTGIFLFVLKNILEQFSTLEEYIPDKLPI